MWTLFTLLACDGAAPSWTSAQDCEAVSGAQADECYAVVAQAIIGEDEPAGVALVNKIQDPLTRDYTWYVITREVYPNRGDLCTRISDKNIADRCKVYVKRPHLSRGKVGGAMPPPPGTQGGPPLGGAGGAGPGRRGPPPGGGPPPPGQDDGPVGPPPPGGAPIPQ